MNVLYSTQTPNIDLSGLTQLLDITATAPVTVAANIRFENLNGDGGNYVNRFILDGVLVLPDSTTLVDIGTTAYVIQSRIVTMLAGQVLQFYGQGTINDTNVTATVSLFDITPITADEILSEIGQELIDQVIAAIADHDIIVKPTTKVLGSCPPTVTKMPKIVQRCP